MKALSPGLADQSTALDAYFDALMVPPQPAAGKAPVPDNNGTLPATDATVPESSAFPGQQTVAPEAAPIQALLFEVAGLTLALPTENVSAVIPLDTSVNWSGDVSTLLPGNFLHAGNRVDVVDIARVVLPADRAARLPEDYRERTRYLVVLDGDRWALACSRTGDVVEFDPDAVRWRTAEGKRRWLAGTVSAKQCVLLDVEGLTQLLDGQMA